jgi:hypothetical protein
VSKGRSKVSEKWAKSGPKKVLKKPKNAKNGQKVSNAGQQRVNND